MSKALTLPVSEEDVRALEVGDEVLFSGRLLTARQAAHAKLVTGAEPGLAALLRGGFVYHCSPIVSQDAAARGWRVVAAGPSTSAREELYEPEVLARYGVRGIVGKGGMGPATLEALRVHGAVYLHAVGGLATALARRVVRVHGVHLLDELGVAEAIWDLEVRDFPAIVTMDAHGESLHARIDAPPAGGTGEER